MAAEVTRSGGNTGGRAQEGGLGSQGLTGLKSLGVRDLQYKTAFLACMVNSADAEGRVRFLFCVVVSGTATYYIFAPILRLEELTSVANTRMGKKARKTSWRR